MICIARACSREANEGFLCRTHHRALPLGQRRALWGFYLDGDEAGLKILVRLGRKKCCTQCKRWLMPRQFWADKTRWDGRGSRCKLCRVKERDTDRHRAYHRGWMQKQRSRRFQ